MIYSLASIAKTLGDFMGVKKLPDGAIQRADPHALTIIDYAPILKGSVYDISPPELTEIEINKIRGQQMLAMMDQRRSARANPNK